MGRAAEERYEKWRAEQVAIAARELTIGRAVYKPSYDYVQEGHVSKIGPVRYDSRGNFVNVARSAADTVLLYWADFGNSRSDPQPYQRDWFARREDALAKLAGELRTRARAARGDADRLDAKALALDLEAGIHEDCAQIPEIRAACSLCRSRPK